MGKSDYDKTMNAVVNFISTFVAIVLFYVLSTYVVGPTPVGRETAGETKVGVITRCTEKETGFLSKSIDYYIYISVPYLYRGNEHIIYKRYSVPGDIYDNYSVGDTADFSVTEYYDYTICRFGGYFNG